MPCEPRCARPLRARPDLRATAAEPGQHEGRAENRRMEIIARAEPGTLDTVRFPSFVLFPCRSPGLTNKSERVPGCQSQKTRGS